MTEENEVTTGIIEGGLCVGRSVLLGFGETIISPYTNCRCDPYWEPHWEWWEWGKYTHDIKNRFIFIPNNLSDLINKIGNETDFIKKANFIYENLLKNLYQKNINNDFSLNRHIDFFYNEELMNIDVKINKKFDINQYILHNKKITLKPSFDLLFSGINYKLNNLVINIDVINNDEIPVTNFDIIKKLAKDKTSLLLRLVHEIKRTEETNINTLTSLDDIDGYKKKEFFKIGVDPLDEIIDVLYLYEDIEELLIKSDLYINLQIKQIDKKILKEWVKENDLYKKINYLKNFNFEKVFKDIRENRMNEVNKILFSKYENFIKHDLDITALSVKQKINLLIFFINRIKHDNTINSIDCLIQELNRMRKDEINKNLNKNAYYDDFIGNCVEINKTANEIINKIASILSDVNEEYNLNKK